MPLDTCNFSWYCIISENARRVSKNGATREPNHCQHLLSKQLVTVNGFHMVAEFQVGLFMRGKSAPRSIMTELSRMIYQQSEAWCWTSAPSTQSPLPYTLPNELTSRSAHTPFTRAQQQKEGETKIYSTCFMWRLILCLKNVIMETPEIVSECFPAWGWKMAYW